MRSSWSLWRQERFTGPQRALERLHGPRFAVETLTLGKDALGLMLQRFLWPFCWLQLEADALNNLNKIQRDGEETLLQRVLGPVFDARVDVRGCAVWIRYEST
jgi:hypothetical protein